MQKSLSCLLMLLCSSIVILGQSEKEQVTLQKNKNNNVHIGEDGISYVDNSSQNIKTNLQNKIASNLEKEYLKQGELRVIINLKNNPYLRNSKNLIQEQNKSIAPLNKVIKELDLQKRSNYNYEFTEDEMNDIEKVTLTDAEKKKIRELNLRIDELQDQGKRKMLNNAINEIIREQKIILDLVENLGGKVTAQIGITNSIAVQFSDFNEYALKELANSPLVKSITPDYICTPDLNVSNVALGTQTFWNNGLDGGAYDAAVIDNGINENHSYLNSHTIYKRDAGVYGNHGTSVAGVIASTHSTYKGVANGMDALFDARLPGAVSESQLRAQYDWVLNCPITAQSPEVANMSYSIYSHTDEFGEFERMLDAVVDDYSVMVIKSAGNKGTSTLGYPQSSNLISVANLDISDSPDSFDWLIRSSSSRGPTQSNRRKPDITAPGHNTWAPYYTSNTAMSNFTGTSAAAPHVAGAIVLLENGGNHNPMAQKAVLINTSRTWSDGGTLTDYTDDGSAGGDRWDRTYGWGIMNLSHAHFHRNDYFTGSVIAKNNTPTDDDYKLYKGHMYNNDKATLVWHRRAVYNGVNDPNAYYNLTDLNLRLFNAVNNTILDSDLDGNDNVHQVSANASYDAVIKVYTWSSSIQGATSEKYALATEENFSLAKPPSFQRNYSRPNWVSPSQTFTVTVRIFNNGEVPAHNNTLNVSNIPKITVIGTNIQSLPSIQPGPYPNNPQTATYTIRTAGASAGTHWLPLNVASSCYLENYTYSTSNGVSIRVDATPAVGICNTPPITLKPNTIPVSWSASDSQSGVKRTYLYVKKSGELIFTYSGMSSTGTSGTFSYVPTKGLGNYQFAVRSVDNVNNWESVPTSAEDSTLYTSLLVKKIN